MTRSSRRIQGRTLARSQALQLLFQAEATGRSVDDILTGPYALSEGPLDEYAERIARGTDERKAELDHVLTAAARNWSLERMSAVDRNLLRLSLFEMLFVDEVKLPVVISECVVLAKAFGGSDESSRFVNGVLGTIATKMEKGTDVLEEGRKLAEEREAAQAEAARTGAEELQDGDGFEQFSYASSDYGYEGDGYGYEGDGYGYDEGYGYERGYVYDGYGRDGYGFDGELRTKPYGYGQSSYDREDRADEAGFGDRR